MIRQETKPKLSKDCSGLSRDFDSRIGRGGKCARRSIDIANHEIREVHRKEIVGVSETNERQRVLTNENIQSNTSDDNSPVPVSVIMAWTAYRTWYQENFALSIFSNASRLRSNALLSIFDDCPCGSRISSRRDYSSIGFDIFGAAGSAPLNIRLHRKSGESHTKILKSLIRS